MWGMLANNIRVIVAKSFADIYRENCLQNGLLPVVLGAGRCRRLHRARGRGERLGAVHGRSRRRRRISGPGGADITFDIPPADRMRLLEGLDDIGLTLKHTDEIVGFGEAHGGEPAVAATGEATVEAVMPVPLPACAEGSGRQVATEEENNMNARKKLRAIMAGKKLVLMPGAYDALSARIIEAEGFEAIVAGGYAGVGSMLAQADMGQSNMRDYADHYGRICDAVEIPVYVDADTGFGGVNNVRQMVRAFEAAGVAGLFISDQVFPNRCGYLPGKQIVPVEQMLAKVKAALDARRDPDLFIAARTDAPASRVRKPPSSAASFSWRPAPTWRSRWASTPSRRSSGRMREIPGPHMATLSQAAGPKARSLRSWKPPASASATFPSVALFAAANAVRNVLRVLKRATRSRRARSISSRSTTTTISSGSSTLLAREESYDKAAAALVQKRAAE